MTIELLILGACILAQGPLTETADSIQSPDAVYPKSVIAGWQIVTAAVPDGFTCASFGWNGTAVVVKAASAEDAAQVLAGAGKEIQTLLDNTAVTHGYDSIISLCSYANSSNAKWKAEGLYGCSYRDACWAKGQEIESAVIARTIPLPTVAEVMAQMPAVAWPV
jgi:hypothetical protein